MLKELLVIAAENYVWPAVNLAVFLELLDVLDIGLSANKEAFFFIL